MVFRDKDGCGAVERQFAQAEIRIGRQDPTAANGAPDLDLTPDLYVSRNHARLRWEGGKWLLEDLGSRRGTRVGGKEIKGLGPVELLPGTPVKMGDTAWAMVPADSLLIYRDGLLVYGACVGTLNYASFHCGLPFVGALTARNIGDADSRPVTLTLELTGFSDACRVEVPSLGPAASASLGVPVLRLHIEQLKRVIEPVRTRLRVHLDGALEAAGERDVLVLGFWDWSYEPSARRTVAAFVSPRNPIVERVVAGAREGLRELAGKDSFGELLRSGREDSERLVLEALYRSMSDRHRVLWLPPESSRLAELGEAYQTIRPPYRIFPHALSHEAQGTCLDLAVLMAGCLENIGLCPVVVLAGEEDGIPRHAFGGCWIGTAPGGRPVLTDAKLLRREVSCGNLLLAEWTGFMEGAGKRLCFDEALKRAAEQVDVCPWLCAVDIKALRPPTGSITPLETPLEPEADRACAEAERLALSKKRQAIETTHLLYGLFATKGPVTRTLCSRAGFDPEDLRLRTHNSISVAHSKGRPVPTSNYQETVRYAEDLAWQAGVHSVREQDLLWALLIKGRDSGKFRRKCKDIGVDLDSLAQLLDEEHPRPDLAPYSSSSFSSSVKE